MFGDHLLDDLAIGPFADDCQLVLLECLVDGEGFDEGVGGFAGDEASDADESDPAGRR